MASIVTPHGSPTLNPLLLEGEELQQAKERATNLPEIAISSREANDLLMMGIGGFTPLTGFMNYQDWKSVCSELTLDNGVMWPIPITLSCDVETAEGLKIGDDVALSTGTNQEIIAVMTLEEKYHIDKLYEADHIYKTRDDKHPGVKLLMQQGEVNLAGSVKVLSEGSYKHQYPGFCLSPQETRSLFEARGWKTVAAFQTRNPMHRAHEYLAKIAIEMCDGLLIHSLLGQLKEGDIPAEVRTKAIAALVENYFHEDNVIQAGYPLDMRYAGPREALLHALFRQNYGCSHIIIGRDHAGVNNIYDDYAAQHIFDEISPDALKIQPIKLDATFWCDRCDEMVSGRICPHDDKSRKHLSGTELRRLLSSGEHVPTYFSRPEVIDVLRNYYRNN